MREDWHFAIFVDIFSAKEKAKPTWMSHRILGMACLMVFRGAQISFSIIHISSIPYLLKGENEGMGKFSWVAKPGKAAKSKASPQRMH